MDTSSLIKLYHNEEGTDKLDKFFVDNIITEIFISEIAKTEFFSAIYKKLRTKELLLQRANDILHAFAFDEGKYTLILINSEIINTSQKLIEKYGLDGLRALDSIQLACAFSVGNSIDMAISGDKMLNSFFHSEGIPIL